MLLFGSRPGTLIAVHDIIPDYIEGRRPNDLTQESRIVPSFPARACATHGRHGPSRRDLIILRRNASDVEAQFRMFCVCRTHSLAGSAKVRAASVPYVLGGLDKSCLIEAALGETVLLTEPKTVDVR